MSSVRRISECAQRLVDYHGLGAGEAQAIIDEVVKRRDRLGRQFDEQELAKRLKDMAIEDLDEARRRALNNKRARVLTLMKTREVGGVIKRFVDSGMNYEKAWHTFLLGGSDWVEGSLNSVAQTRLGLERLFTAKFALWSRQNGPVLKALKKARPGEGMDLKLTEALLNKKYDGSPINELAGLMAESLEGFRVAANDAGLDIGRMAEGYLPHRHDRQKLVAGKFEKFYDVVMRTADLERTYGKMDDYTEAIRGTYETILGNQAEYFDGAGFIQTRTGAGLEKHREIHFNGPQGWGDYAKEFGQGGVWDGVMNYLDGGVRQLAVIQRLGPKPEETMGRLIDGLKVTDEASRIFKEANSSQRLRQRRGPVADYYSVVSGETLIPDSFGGAKVSSLIRSAQSLAKLGGATLSAIADLPVAAMRLKTNHGQGLMQSWLETVTNFFHRVPAGERAEFGAYFDAVCEGIQGDMAQRFDLENPMSDKMNRLMRTFFKYNGLTPWTDAMKTGMYMGISGNVGFHARTGFSDLPLRFRETLKMYGFDEARWDVVRGTMLRKIGDKEYLCPELARELDDDLVDQLTAPQWGNVLEEMRRDRYFSGYVWSTRNRAYDFLPLEMKSILDKYGLKESWDIIRKHLVEESEYGEISFSAGPIQHLPDDLVDAATEAKWKPMADSIGLANSTATPQGLDALKAQLRQEFKNDLEVNLKQAENETTLQAVEVMKESLRRQFKAKLEADAAGFLSGEVNKAVLTPDERNRYALLRGTRPGTVVGEGLRFATQFKSFPTLFIQQVLKPIWASRKVQDIGWGGALSTMGLMMAQCTLFGAVAMEAKRMARGEKPYALSEDPNWAAAFGAAFTQGGGAGLYGDFLLGEHNRFGQSFLESAAGPTAGTVNDAFKMLGKTRTSAARAAGLSDGVGLTGADVLRFGQNNAPGLNVWYARLALDWAFMWDLQELVSPGTQARRVKRARSEGREYWLSPKDDRARLFTD